MHSDPYDAMTILKLHTLNHNNLLQFVMGAIIVVGSDPSCKNSKE